MSEGVCTRVVRGDISWFAADALILSSSGGFSGDLEACTRRAVEAPDGGGAARRGGGWVGAGARRGDQSAVWAGDDWLRGWRRGRAGDRCRWRVGLVIQIF